MARKKKEYWIADRVIIVDERDRSVCKALSRRYAIKIVDALNFMESHKGNGHNKKETK